MPRYICHRNLEGVDLFLEWSTVVDAPVTYAMTEDEFRVYHREEYGRSSDDGVDERIARAKTKGCSSRDPNETFEDLIRCNRAGANETEMSERQIVEYYFRDFRQRRSEDDGSSLPVGTVVRVWNDDGSEGPATGEEKYQ